MRDPRTIDDILQDIRDIEPFECGSDTSKEQFAFDLGYVFLNHGSYGTHSLPVRNVFRYYQERAEAQPDTFVRYEYRPKLLDESRLVIADYLDVSVETCVYTINASMGIDTVLRNIIYQPGDVIICFSSIYGSFGHTIQHLSETSPVEAHTIILTYPLPDDEIISAFQYAITSLQAQNKRPRLALFDTISSLPATRVPFERLTQICRSENILSCIDGAHGVGHMPLSLTTLDPDFFSSNLHKWLHVPRGCAILYTPLRNQHLLRTTFPTGFGFVAESDGPPNYVQNFASLGTLDDTPYLCVKAALEWRKRLTWNGKSGEEAIMSYTRHLAKTGGQAVATILNTEVLDNYERTLSQCSMTNIRLPLAKDQKSDKQLNEAAAQIQKTMAFDYKTAINAFVYNGSVWVRLSAQVYLNLADFERAGHALKSVCRSYPD
ncbi:Putative aminotransferase class V domain, pyridoxal phosphate-dependent transferase, major [Septoria linicola]|uniref:Aminotransferase class V domain, pyridoxal phosphate-dependent transferase, major n=1 Tax=Septoria linicola TaxID=215465 RepID=A0A9Q9EGV0_9PEZI|nr:putative aminotransferase class V domain, pyridoxal phosphate-dependent transferase, major [Septoria linicola]USW49304.1 Putative aminotransferase class V domain, pyridoxal phosphate-dependent transferase, major [Septoria linicola]